MARATWSWHQRSLLPLITGTLPPCKSPFLGQTLPASPCPRGQDRSLLGLAPDCCHGLSPCGWCWLLLLPPLPGTAPAVPLSPGTDLEATRTCDFRELTLFQHGAQGRQLPCCWKSCTTAASPRFPGSLVQSLSGRVVCELCVFQTVLLQPSRLEKRARDQESPERKYRRCRLGKPAGGWTRAAHMHTVRPPAQQLPPPQRRVSHPPSIPHARLHDFPCSCLLLPYTKCGRTATSQRPCVGLTGSPV